MNKRRLMELFVVGFFIILISYFIIAVFFSSPGQEMPALDGTAEDCPILVLSVGSSNYDINSEGCFVVINGSVTNIGAEDAKDIIIRCRPSIHPIIETEIQASKKIGDLEIGKQTFFEIERDTECSKRFEFDCIAECQNC